MRLLRLVVTSLALICSIQPQSLTLTLREAQDLALKNNPQISAAGFDAEASAQVPVEIRAGLYPTVTGAVTAVGADSGSRLAAGALNNPVVYNRVGTGLIVNQLVTDFGRTTALASSAKLRAQAQDQAVQATRANVLIATTQAYFAVLRTRNLLTIAQQTLAARQLVANQVSALADSNLKSQLDVSFANVNVADAQLLLSQTENAAKASEVDLATALGLPGQTSFVLREEPLPDAPPSTSDAFVMEAIQNRPELKDLRLRQDSAEELAKAEHSLTKPTISVSGAAGFVPASGPAVPGRYGAIGINLSIPVFNGGLFRARQSEAELKAKAARESVNDLANRVTRDVRVASLNAQTAYARMGLTTQLLNQAQLALDLARGRYDLGLSSIVELSQAQLNLTSAQIASASAQYDYQTQHAIVDYQVGSLR